MRTCRVPGCDHRTSGWAAYCNAHKTRDRRHGHPLQDAVTKAELSGYTRLVQNRTAKNPDSPAWDRIAVRWHGLVDHCRGIVAMYGARRAVHRYHLQAAQEIIKIAEDVEPQEAVETALAMVMMYDLDPRRFRSDQAFRVQFVRRMRGLTDLNCGSWFDHTTGKVKKAYRDLPPKAAKIMASLLMETFGMVGLMLARLEKEQEAEDREEKKKLTEALKELR